MSKNKKKVIENKLLTFEDFLSQYNNHIVIPYYQRNYVWSQPDNEHVLRKFINDIIDQFENDQDKQYLVGNFAMCKSSVNYVVDGQQRITSLLILLKLCADYSGKNVKQRFYDYNNQFVIECPSVSKDSLADLLEGALFTGKISSVNPVSDAVDIIKSELERFKQRRIADISNGLFADLLDYILECVQMMISEFTIERDALRYFLNINSLSVQLTEMEIFYAYLSELIAVNKMSVDIGNIRDTVNNIDDKIKQLTDEDFVYIFLKSYFKNDDNIGSLRGFANKNTKTGVGKWMTSYKMSLMSNPTEAIAFVKSFNTYVSQDALKVLNCFLGINSNIDNYQYIYFIMMFNRSNNNKHMNTLLLSYFMSKCDYHNVVNITESNLNKFCKTAAITIIANIFNTGSNKYDPMRNLPENIENNERPTSIQKSIRYSNIHLLTYPKDLQSSKSKKNNGIRIKDNHEEIKFILSFQEAYLNSVHNPTYNMNSVLQSVWLGNNFTIEHLFSTKEFTDSKRVTEWSKIKKFDQNSPDDFDIARSSFENLSLLSANANSSAGTKVMNDKAKVYKNSHTIMTSNEPELLISSLIEDSDYYNSPNIKALGLPDRYIKINTDGVTWELSENNRAFNEKLCELAVNEYFK